MLEQIKNGFTSEPINEAGDQQNDTGLKNVLSGQNGGAYVNQWNQLMKDYQSKNGKAGTYTIMIVHDGASKKEMVNLQYQIGADGKPVKDSIKLAAAAAASNTKSSINPDKLATYNPNGKYAEFVAALITESATISTGWSQTRIKWVNDQISICSARINTFNTLSFYSGYAFLKGTGDVSGNISALGGGDRDAVNGVLNDTALKNAGSADTQARMNTVLVAINKKLDELQISQTDEKSLVALYQLIHPMWGSGQIEASWKALGFDGAPLTNIVNEFDAPTKYIELMVWAVGVRALSATVESTIALTGFDTASYKASLAAIKAALV